jgi:hypothetical protein
MVAELATLIPEEGGYYVWIKESLGESWAVQEAWWTMAYSIALMAMLPLLFHEDPHDAKVLHTRAVPGPPVIREVAD